MLDLPVISILPRRIDHLMGKDYTVLLPLARCYPASLVDTIEADNN